jgi:hypothetical protein
VGDIDMTIDTHRAVEIEASSIRMLGLAALGLLMTALSAVLALPNVAPGSEFIGYVGAVLFGALTVLILWRTLTTHGPVVTITREGIRDSRIAAELIPWSAINDISTWQYQRQRAMVLAVDPAVERGLHLTRIARWTRGANRAFGIDGLCVTAQGLKIGYDELFAASLAYAQASRSAAPSAPRHASAEHSR